MSPMPDTQTDKRVKGHPCPHQPHGRLQGAGGKTSAWKERAAPDWRSRDCDCDSFSAPYNLNLCCEGPSLLIVGEAWGAWCRSCSCSGKKESSSSAREFVEAATTSTCFVCEAGERYSQKGPIPLVLNIYSCATTINHQFHMYIVQFVHEL